MRQTIMGFAYLFQGFKLISKPGIKRYVLIPLVINISLFIGLFFFIRHVVSHFNLWLAHHLPSWLQWLNTILWLFFFISFLLVLAYTFVTLANFISAPFNSLLAEKVELYLTGKTLEQRSLLATIQDMPRIIMRQLAILGYYLPRAILILILFLIPIIHLFAAIFWFLFNAWFIALTYLDYPSDNHRIPLKVVRQFMQEKPWAVLGFGITTLFATMIPILNLFTMPAAVAAATKFWVEENK